MIYESTKDYEFVIRNYAFAMQNWNLTPRLWSVDHQQQQQQQQPFHINSEVHPLLSLQLLLAFLSLP
jgi:hypothetical protein